MFEDSEDDHEQQAETDNPYDFFEADVEAEVERRLEERTATVEASEPFDHEAGKLHMEELRARIAAEEAEAEEEAEQSLEPVSPWSRPSSHPARPVKSTFFDFSTYGNTARQPAPVVEIAKPKPVFPFPVRHLAKAEYGLFPIHGMSESGQCACGDETCSTPGAHPFDDCEPKDATSNLAVLETHWEAYTVNGVPPNWAWVVNRKVFAIDAVYDSPGYAWIQQQTRDYKEDLTEEAEGRYKNQIYRSLKFIGGVTLYQTIPGVNLKSRELKTGLRLVAAGEWVVAPGSRHRMPYNPLQTFEMGMEGSTHSFREPEPFLVDLLKTPTSSVRVQDILDIRSRPNVHKKAVIPGLLYESETTVFSAPAGLGKSFFTASMTTAIAMGGTFLGHKLDARKVLYLDYENSPRQLEDRLNAFKLPADNPNFKLWDKSVPGGCLKAGDPRLAEWISELVESGELPPVLVVDTLRSAMTGDLKQDADVKAFFALLDEYKALGCAVIVLVHSGTKSEGTKIFLGSEAIIGCPDSLFLLARKGGNVGPIKDLDILTHKGRSLSEFPCKARVTFNADATWSIQTVKGEDLAVDAVEQGLVSENDAHGSMMAIMLEHPKGVKTRQFVTLCGELEKPIHRNRANQFLIEGEKNGLFTVTPGANNSKTYRLI